MEFIPLDSKSALEETESDRPSGISERTGGRELKEQDLLRTLEGYSGDKTDAVVDCTLKLGFSTETKPQTSTFDPTPRMDMPPIIISTPQVMERYGMMTGGWSIYNNSGCGSIGASHLNWLPNMAKADGYGFFGGRSMAAVPAPAASNGFTGFSNPQKNMSRVYKRKTKGVAVGCGRKCAACETTNTPLWRNGPKGSKSLCNACGIRFKKEERRKEEGNASGFTYSRTNSKCAGTKEDESSKKPKI